MKNPIGLGLRREIAQETLAMQEHKPDFLELAPENWMRLGGFWKRILAEAAEKYPLTAHGISLSIGSTSPMPIDFLKEIRQFLEDYQISLYSEHLCFSQCENAHLFELFPIPFTNEAVTQLSTRIQIAQEILERPLILEIISYYSQGEAEMSEAEFISAVVRESGCQLLLDVNNVYVNAVNHGYDALDFIRQLPLDAVRYIHIAGHTVMQDGYLIDTHAEAVQPAVFQLFQQIIHQLPPEVPVLLERDNNFAGVEVLGAEMGQLRSMVG